MEVDRRSSSRYPFVAVARVREIISQTESDAHTSDISNGRYFVDKLNPLPVGTALHITISHGVLKFAALGNVVFALPNMGMGIMFVAVEPESRTILEQWIAEAHPESNER